MNIINDLEVFQTLIVYGLILFIKKCKTIENKNFNSKKFK